MEVTITRLRQDLFKLADRALEGEPVKFTYKGIVFKLAPEAKALKLARLTKQTVVAARTELDTGSAELLKEMEAEWEKDWSEL